MRAQRADRRRRAGALLVAAGLLCAAGAASTWGAPGASAAPLFSYDLRASARGFSFFGGFGGQNQTTGLPESTATLANGPVGLGIASLVWPGSLGGNPGQLVNVLQPGCAVTGPAQLPSPNPVCPAPDAATELRYPIKAEARTGQDPPTTTNEDVPGASMKASATAQEVSADAVTTGIAGVPGDFGRIVTHSVVKYAGETGTSEATSTVQDVDVGGVIQIESVVSSASASTDGTTGGGDATTTVTGLTIGGTPVDLGPAGVPEETKQLLEPMGMEVVVGPPVKEVDGSSATMTAGSVVITWDTPDGVYGIVLGGAQAAVAGSPDTAVDLGVVDVPLDTGATGSIDVPSAEVADVGAVDVPVPADTPDEVVLDTTPAFDIGGTPIRASTAVLAMLAVALLAVGMQRLGTGVLLAAPAAACPLGEDS